MKRQRHPSRCSPSGKKYNAILELYMIITLCSTFIHSEESEPSMAKHYSSLGLKFKNIIEPQSSSNADISIEPQSFELKMLSGEYHSPTKASWYGDSERISSKSHKTSKSKSKTAKSSKSKSSKSSKSGKPGEGHNNSWWNGYHGWQQKLPSTNSPSLSPSSSLSRPTSAPLAPTYPTYAPTSPYPTYSPTGGMTISSSPSTPKPTLAQIGTSKPTTYEPTSYAPTTYGPTTYGPTTFMPTKVPSSRPTTDPTNIPTNDPTSDPTNNPTNEPTNTPTYYYYVPTYSPTYGTYEPTTQLPSPLPSTMPSLEPSVGMQALNTFTATEHPSLQPSVSLSDMPSREPFVWPKLDGILYNPVSIEKSRTMSDDGQQSSFFGASVAIDHHTLVIGIQDNNKDQGSSGMGSARVYRYSIEAGSFVPEGNRLMSSDGHSMDDFGRSVAISQDYILIGAQKHDSFGVSSGAAYVYQQVLNADGTVEWVEMTKLVPPREAATAGDDERFGISVAIHNGVAIVGANGNDANGENSGAAYIFTLLKTASASSEWVYTQKLVASDGGAGDNYGFSVAIHGNKAVVGSVWDEYGRGSAYVYKLTEDNNLWVEEGKFTAEGGGQPDDQFGWSVSIFEDTVAVGAFSHDANGFDSGAVYVFLMDNMQGEWKQQARLAPSVSKANDHFGRSVRMFEDWLVVSAPFDDSAGIEAGAVYIYKRTGKDWILEAKRVPAQEEPLDFSEFGFGVGASKDFFVVTSKYSNNAANDDVEEEEEDSSFGDCHVFETGEQIHT